MTHVNIKRKTCLRFYLTHEWRQWWGITLNSEVKTNRNGLCIDGEYQNKRAHGDKLAPSRIRAGKSIETNLHWTELACLQTSGQVFLPRRVIRSLQSCKPAPGK